MTTLSARSLDLPSDSFLDSFRDVYYQEKPRPPLARASPGIYRLMFAVLQEALHNLRVAAEQSQSNPRKRFRAAQDARLWIQNRGRRYDSYPFSFYNICTEIGLDPDALTANLHRIGWLEWEQRKPDLLVLTGTGLLRRYNRALGSVSTARFQIRERHIRAV